MVDKLEFTGERFTPECEREIWYEHIHRYAFAAQYCEGKQVLDAACGEGYGSSMLAKTAATVIGVDIDDDAISHAQQRYADQTNLEFQTADCTELPFGADRFDLIVCFETLEHLIAQQSMMSGFRRVLKPGGMLILSSPDKAEYSDKQGFQNEFHVKELYRDELQNLISKDFPACRLLGQKLTFHSAIWDLEGVSKVSLQTSFPDGEISKGMLGHPPMYFIALCAASDDCLPDLSGSLNLFDDSNETVYRHYQHEIEKNMAAGGIIADRDAQIQALKNEKDSGKPWWRRLTGKN